MEEVISRIDWAPDSPRIPEVEPSQRNAGSPFLDDRIDWCCKSASRYPWKTADKIQRSIVYMMEHLDGPISIDELCRVVDLSPAHFFAVFRSVTGHSPKRFFVRVKMRRACELIRGTDLSMKRIAGLIGFKDPLHFSRTFKTIVGQSPSEYRRMPSLVSKGSSPNRLRLLQRPGQTK
jgi:AraC-like DNA-binding protein